MKGFQISFTHAETNREGLRFLWLFHLSASTLLKTQLHAVCWPLAHQDNPLTSSLASLFGSLARWASSWPHSCGFAADMCDPWHMQLICWSAHDHFVVLTQNNKHACVQICCGTGSLFPCGDRTSGSAQLHANSSLLVHYWRRQWAVSGSVFTKILQENITHIPPVFLISLMCVSLIT